MTRLPVLLAAALALALPAGCGFHLRGSVEIPTDLNPMYVVAQNRSPVKRAIEEALAGSTVRLTADRTEAGLTLRILSERRDSRVVAVDSTGRVLAYELHYLVTFDAIAADGKTRVPSQTLDLLRTFNDPDAFVLGKQLEEEIIYEEFAYDAADRILMILRAVLTSSRRSSAA